MFLVLSLPRLARSPLWKVILPWSVSFQSDQVLPPTLCLAAEILWLAEGRRGQGRTSAFGSSGGWNQIKWWQNRTLISLTSHWTKSEDGNRWCEYLYNELLFLAKNAQNVELSHSEDERWKERIRDERHCTARHGRVGSGGLCWVNNMASLGYIRIFCDQRVGRVSSPSFLGVATERGELQHHPNALCAGCTAGWAASREGL